jgi:alpha,alpha-trehalase
MARCREDVNLADAAHFPHGSAARGQLYCELASAAESGWDFSSRWCASPGDLQSIRTTRIVPADLNVYIWRQERMLADLAAALGHDAAAAKV